jgi:hypothetical protein
VKHFHRTSVTPDVVLREADAFFAELGMKASSTAARARSWEGVVGTPEEPVTLTLTVKMEGGHYTFVEAHSSAMGESRLDRNVKKFFVRLHKLADPRHATAAAY